jgi:signal transduction histidine kinase
MNLRAHNAPHILFVVFLTIFALIALQRFRRHIAYLRNARDRIETASKAVQRTQDLHRQQRHASDLLEAHVYTQTTASHAAFLQQLAKYREETQAVQGDFPDIVFLEQLSHQLDQTARVSAADYSELRERFRTLDALWAQANQTALRRLGASATALQTQHERLLREALVGVIVVLLLTLAYVIGVNLMLTRPLRALAGTMEQVTAGDLDARAEARGDGPIPDLARDLNRMVAILVETLTEEERVVCELRKSNSELEAANRHKSQFLATVSHELKTPLNAIIGFADILGTEHHGPLNERQKDYTQRMFTAGEHLLGMISDLIDIAKIDIDALELSPAPFALNELLCEVRDMLAPQVAAKGHELTVDAPEGLTVNLDRRRVKQILVNLANNAIKFTPARGHIRLACEVNKQRAKLTVADDGIGIAEHDRERIFEDFVQLDSRLQRQHEGTGIGLALTLRLTRLMGGSIDVDSAADAGTTFTVRLPLSSVCSQDSLATR